MVKRHQPGWIQFRPDTSRIKRWRENRPLDATNIKKKKERKNWAKVFLWQRDGFETKFFWRVFLFQNRKKKKEKKEKRRQVPKLFCFIFGLVATVLGIYFIRTPLLEERGKGTF